MTVLKTALKVNAVFSYAIKSEQLLKEAAYDHTKHKWKHLAIYIHLISVVFITKV